MFYLSFLSGLYNSGMLPNTVLVTCTNKKEVLNVAQARLKRLRIVVVDMAEGDSTILKD